MKTDLQRRLSILTEAHNYCKKMQEGSVFVTDFAALRLMNRLIVEMQDLLAENLKFEEELKMRHALRKKKKE